MQNVVHKLVRNYVQKKVRKMAKAKTEPKKLTEVEKGKLADAFQVTVRTINNWIDKEEPRLTSDLAKTTLNKKDSK